MASFISNTYAIPYFSRHFSILLTNLAAALGVSVHRTEIIPFAPDPADTGVGKSKYILLHLSLAGTS